MSQDIQSLLPELKRLIEAVNGWGNVSQCWPTNEDGVWEVGGITDGEKYPVLSVDTDQYFAQSHAEHLAKFYAAANPAAVQTLIAHIEALERQLAELRQETDRGDGVCSEPDGCPTELAVLKRFWRKHQAVRQAPDGYYCAIAEADFELDTVTLKMEPGYRVRAGRHMLVPLTAAPSAKDAP